MVTRVWEMSQAYEVVQGESVAIAQWNSIDTRTQT